MLCRQRCAGTWLCCLRACVLHPALPQSAFFNILLFYSTFLLFAFCFLLFAFCFLLQLLSPLREEVPDSPAAATAALLEEEQQQRGGMFGRLLTQLFDQAGWQTDPSWHHGGAGALDSPQACCVMCSWQQQHSGCCTFPCRV